MLDCFFLSWRLAGVILCKDGDKSNILTVLVSSWESGIANGSRPKLGSWLDVVDFKVPSTARLSLQLHLV